LKKNRAKKTNFFVKNKTKQQQEVTCLVRLQPDLDMNPSRATLTPQMQIHNAMIRSTTLLYRQATSLPAVTTRPPTAGGLVVKAPADQTKEHGFKFL